MENGTPNSPFVLVRIGTALFCKSALKVRYIQSVQKFLRRFAVRQSFDIGCMLLCMLIDS